MRQNLLIHTACWALGVCWLLMAATDVRADLVVRGYDPAKHDRFANSPQFIGNAYDWSGVGRTSQGQWATMISANYFVSATHFAPLIGDTLTLYGSNNVNGPSQTVNVVGGQQIAGSDLWLGRIDTATQFTTYAVANPANLIGQDVFMFGVGSGYPVTAQMRVGRNTIDEFIPKFSHQNLGSSVSDVVLYDYDAPTGGTGDDEAVVRGGDSGAPTFIIADGKPALVGVHWFLYTSGDFNNPSSGSGDTALPGYVNALMVSMGGQQLNVVAVPEPGSLALVGFPCALWFAGRWRRSSAARCGS